MRRYIPMIAGLVGLTTVVMGLVLWAILSGEAGTQRGLIVRNEVSETVVVRLEDGQSAEIGPKRQATFVLKRENFPQTLTATTLAGDVVAEQEFPYDEIASAEFRWDVDRAGFFPTQEIRTIVP